MNTNLKDFQTDPFLEEDGCREALWMRICAFQLDDPDSNLPFSKRLAQENGWSRHFASRVVEEYKKFCYIAVTAAHAVTPSDEVDQAWHLHLLYTRSYWDGFCAHALGRPLHHGPTQGGSEEREKFRVWYERTLSSYHATFGPPSPDIWPEPEIRFASGTRFRRIDLAKYWLLPKPGICGR
jgi:hypothetical protein